MNLLRKLLGLSRFPHSLLDVALPAFCALAWLGTFPSMRVTLLGLLTATSAYLAIYAMNDLIDCYTDREKESLTPKANHEGYIDALLTIHPLAKGQLSFKASFFWVFGLLLIALVGAYALNPFTIWILAFGAICEISYCLLFKKSALRIILSGIVKSCGPIASIYAVDSTPNPTLLLLLFLSIFLWEIGGQNIPADWVDIAQDRAVHAKTFPIQYGLKTAGIIIFGSLSLSILVTLGFLTSLPNAFNLFWLLIVLLSSLVILMMPAYKLFRSGSHTAALGLFNSACYYPLWMLILTAAKIYLG
ncbi:MAG: UbiA family prenyltransferase [Legionellales bacterium]|nr:UbiA family prenyltransferase [Legionellales bacterium]